MAWAGGGGLVLLGAGYAVFRLRTRSPRSLSWSNRRIRLTATFGGRRLQAACRSLRLRFERSAG